MTRRCASEDLDMEPGANFEALMRHVIVGAFVRERVERPDGGRQVAPLTCGQAVFRIGHQHEHRGATLFDPIEAVVWLVAYRRHRSGQADDFFPYCKGLDRDGRLLPTEEDYEDLFDDRGQRFAQAARIELPMLLKRARERPGKRVGMQVGGNFGIELFVEVAEDLEATTVVVRKDSVDVWRKINLILAVLHGPDDWEQVPERPDSDVIIFRHHHEP